MLAIMVVGDADQLKADAGGVEFGVAMATYTFRKLIDLHFPHRMDRLNRVYGDGNIIDIGGVQWFDIGTMIKEGSAKQYTACVVQFLDMEVVGAQACDGVPDAVCYYGAELNDGDNWKNEFFRSRLFRECEDFKSPERPYTLRDFMCHIESTRHLMTKVTTKNRTSLWAHVTDDPVVREPYVIVEGDVDDVYLRNTVARNVFMLHAIL